MPLPAHSNAEDPRVHPLHFGIDRQAQGRAATLVRLSGVRVYDAIIRVFRLSRGRLSTGAPPTVWPLGHRPQLHSLRALAMAEPTLIFYSRFRISLIFAVLDVIPETPQKRATMSIFSTTNTYLQQPAPPSIRARFQAATSRQEKTLAQSLRLLARGGRSSVSLEWYQITAFGDDSASRIVDTWWHTETWGGIPCSRRLPGPQNLQSRFGTQRSRRGSLYRRCRWQGSVRASPGNL